MYIGGLNRRGLRLIIDGVLSEQLGACGAAFSHVIISILPDAFIDIEFVGDAPSVRPNHFAREDFDLDAEFFSLTIAATFGDPLRAEIIRDGHRWVQTYRAGVPVSPAAQNATDSPNRFSLRFRPDPSLFAAISVGLFQLCAEVQDFAIFNVETRFSIRDETSGGVRRDFHYPNGLWDYAEEIHPDILEPNRWHLKYADGAESVDVVMFNSGIGPCTVHAFVNGMRIIDGGDHIEGLAQAIAEIAADKLHPASAFFDFREPRLEGTTILISLKLAEPQWAGTTKTRLAGPRPKDLVYRVVRRQLPDCLAKTLRP